MLADLNLSSLSLSPKKMVLKDAIIEELAETYYNVRDLPLRLFKLPVIPKGKLVAKFPATNPTEYATEYGKVTGLDTYIGYFVYRDEQTKKWICQEHVFNVSKQGKVQECCKMKWNTESYYVGMKIPASDLKGLRFTMLFSRLSYINEHSPRALFEPKKKEEEDERIWEDDRIQGRSV
ncbi:hypothetical protein BN7874_174 [Phage NCTB]|nr:hypothetical protein BN7874_174 [Phage NCTB]